jgi:hypothetical protein
MTKKQWGTVVFALEQYIQECENEIGHATPHIYQTLWQAVAEQDKAND